MNNTILHISHKGCIADILASEVRAIIRLAPKMAATVAMSHPECTRVDYSAGSITLPISREEHDALVSAWRGSAC